MVNSAKPIIDEAMGQAMTDFALLNPSYALYRKTPER
jgi:hypothetical protein